MGDQQKRAATPATEGKQTSNGQKQASENKLEGEGSYTATRRYNQNLASHQKNENVDELAEDAREAVEGEEGEELRRAEEQGKRGPSKGKATG